MELWLMYLLLGAGICVALVCLWWWGSGRMWWWGSGRTDRTRKNNMGMREREPWMKLIDRIQVPHHVKKLMWARVHAHDQALASTIGDLELLYLRLIQDDGEIAERLHGTLVQRITGLEREVLQGQETLQTAQAALAQARTALNEAEQRRDEHLLNRAEHARLASIADACEET